MKKSLENDDQFVERMIKQAVLPSLVSLLLQNNLLDQARLNDKKYVMSMIKKHNDLISDLRVQVIYCSQFRESLKSELSSNRHESAVVMTAVINEHLLNMFYQNLLPLKFELSSNEVSKTISRLRVPDKIGWFLKITANWELPANLSRQLLTINNIRNSIVHYHGVPEDLDGDQLGSHSEIKEKIKQLRLNTLEDITLELEHNLQQALEHSFPDLKHAREICASILW